MYKQLLSTQQKHWNILKELNLFIFTQPRILSLVKPLQNESISHHLITYPPRTLNTLTASPTTHTTIAQLISPPLSHHHSHTTTLTPSFQSTVCPPNCNQCTYSASQSKTMCLTTACQPTYVYISSDGTCAGQSSQHNNNIFF